MSRAFSLHGGGFPPFFVKQIEQRVVLNYVRIQANSNKFYILEFQEGEGEYAYRIYTEYGRMGRFPRKQGRYFHTRPEARNEFDKLLLSKRKKGYELIMIEEEWDGFSLIPSSPPFQQKPLLPTPSLSFHTEWGNLSEMQLQRGIQILDEIEEKIHNGTPDVMQLTNQFYSVIPVVFGNRIDRSYLLDNLEKVHAKKKWLREMTTTLQNPFPVKLASK